MAHPPQQQQPSPGQSSPQFDDQEKRQYPGDEGLRPPLVQVDAESLGRAYPRNVLDEGQRDAPETQAPKARAERSGDEPELGTDPTEPIGDRKDIR